MVPVGPTLCVGTGGDAGGNVALGAAEAAAGDGAVALAGGVKGLVGAVEVTHQATVSGSGNSTQPFWCIRWVGLPAEARRWARWRSGPHHPGSCAGSLVLAPRMLFLTFEVDYGFPPATFLLGDAPGKGVKNMKSFILSLLLGGG